ncbi:MAG: hypothetical protein Q8R83_02680 [Legionellaceae bacterium]|nr:hypothetical protein [Legionellaceae bacterium]
MRQLVNCEEIPEEYPFMIKKYQGFFYVICSAFNLVEHDLNLNDAYLRASQKRQDLIIEFKKIGMNIPSYNLGDIKTISPIRRTVKKLFTLGTILFLILGMYFASIITDKIIELPSLLKEKIKASTVSIVSNPDALFRATQTIAQKIDTANPETKAQFQSNVRKIVQFFEPMIAEMEPLKTNKIMLENEKKQT